MTPSQKELVETFPRFDSKGRRIDNLPEGQAPTFTVEDLPEPVPVQRRKPKQRTPRF